MIADRILIDQTSKGIGQDTVEIGAAELRKAISSLAEIPPGPEYHALYTVTGSGGILRVEIGRINLIAVKVNVYLLRALQMLLVATCSVATWYLLFSKDWFVGAMVCYLLLLGVVKLQEQIEPKKKVLHEYQ